MRHRAWVIGALTMLGAASLRAQGSMSTLTAFQVEALDDRSGMSTISGAFGGTAISPVSAVVQNYLDGKVMLRLSAHTRCKMNSLSYATCDMPGPVTNNGANTFFALAGGNSIVPDVQGGTTFSGTLARWNFAYSITGSGLQDYSYKLLYDFNPAAGNALTGGWAWSGFGFGGNQNLGYGGLATGFAQYGVTVTGPGGSFNPATPGEHTFRLEAYDANSAMVAHSTMNVVTYVPEPSSYALMAAGLGALLVVRRRRRTV